MRFVCPLYRGIGEAPIIEIQFKRKTVQVRNTVYLPCRRCKSNCRRDRNKNRRIPLFGPNGILFPNIYK